MEKFYNQEFYTAIMDEDVDHIEDLTNKYGSNFLICVLDTAPGDLWKVKEHFSSFYKNVIKTDKGHNK